MATRDYVIRMPPDTLIPAACQDVGCANWQHGWDTAVSEATPEGRDAASWLRSGQSGREFREMGTREDGLTVFRFASGQRCFAEHQTRPARWLAGGADRGHMGAWLDDLDNHLGGLADQIRKG